MKISNSELEPLRNGFHGTILTPSDDAYDEARTIWNGMVDKRPAVIARCAGTEDAARAVNFARDKGLLLAVRGAGHRASG